MIESPDDRLFRFCPAGNAHFPLQTLDVRHVLHVLTVLFFLGTLPSCTRVQDENPGREAGDALVGRWEFDDGAGRDLSGYGNDAVPEDKHFYSLGGGHGCLKITPETGPAYITASSELPLAILRGSRQFFIRT